MTKSCLPWEAFVDMVQAVVLFPFGGNAREAAGVVEAINAQDMRYEILGFLDDNHASLLSADYPLLGGSGLWEQYRGETRLLALPGSPASYRRRREIIGKFALTEADSLTLAAPSSRVARGAQVGFNTLLMAGTFVSCGVRIGNHCVILPNSVISHDAEIGDYTLVGSNVSVSGGVRIGENCYIGSGAAIREGVSVGSGALLGIGTTVIRDVPENAVVVGSPARVIRMSQ